MRILIRFPSGKKIDVENGRYLGAGFDKGIQHWIVAVESDHQKDAEGRWALIAADPRALILTGDGEVLYNPYDAYDEPGYPDEMKKLLLADGSWRAVCSAACGEHQGAA